MEVLYPLECHPREYKHMISLTDSLDYTTKMISRIFPYRCVYARDAYIYSANMKVFCRGLAEVDSPTQRRPDNNFLQIQVCLLLIKTYVTVPHEEGGV